MGSTIGANPTKATPLGRAVTSPVATASARRVLPMPGAPVRVRRRSPPGRSRWRNSANSRLRPIRGVTASGSVGAVNAAVGETDPRGPCLRLTAASSVALSSAERRRALASRRTVSRYGRRRTPRSKSLIARTLSPACSARASWENPAAIRYLRSMTANDADGSVSMACNRSN